MTYHHLPREARVKMADLANRGKHRGITGLSEMTIRRLIAKGEFPAPKYYPAMPRSAFFIYAEILDWMEEQNNRNAEGWRISTKKAALTFHLEVRP